MTNLTIYDSHGKPYGEGGTGRSNERIEEFFFGGVKLYLDAGSRTELVVFFRARESNVGRAEQFYAVYETRSTRNLFENFKSDLRQRVETEHGMSIQTSSDDVQVYNSLGDRNNSVPGSEFDHSVISNLLRSGNRLRFGVGSANEALGLCSAYLQESANRIAIADNTDIDALENCDLAVEIGSYRGLEPLGETSRLMDEQRRSMEGQLINEKLTTIKQEVEDLRTKTSKSDEQIRNRLKRQLSILETPPPPSSNDGRLDALPSLSRPQKIAGGVAGLLVLIALVSVVTAGLLGVPAPLADALGFDDGTDDAEAAIEDLTLGDVDLADGDERQTVTLTDGELTVAGTTNQEAVRVTFEPDDGDSVSDEANVEDDSFDVTLTDLEPGNGELTVEAGPIEDEDVAAETSRTIPLELETAASLENLTVNGTAFEDAETVSLSDGNVTVAGETDQPNVSVTVAYNDSTEVNATAAVANETFDVTLTDLESGNATLTVAAGTTVDGDNETEFESAIDESVDLEFVDDSTDSASEGEPEDSGEEDEPEPSLEGLTVNGTAFEDAETVSLSPGSVTVAGETNQQNVSIAFEYDNRSEVNETAPVTDGSFDVTFDDLESGNGTLTVEAGVANDDEPFDSPNDSIEFVIDAPDDSNDSDDPTLANIEVGETAFDDLEENDTVSISDGELEISGESDQDDVRVEFEYDDDSVETKSNVTAVDDNGQFTVTLSDLETGSGTLTVSAGTETDGGFDPAVEVDEPKQIELTEQ